MPIDSKGFFDAGVEYKQEGEKNLVFHQRRSKIQRYCRRSNPTIRWGRVKERVRKE
jgi:hypothetical protein